MGQDRLGEYLSGLAYKMNMTEEPAEPQSAITRESYQELDARESMAESLVIPRESLFGPPPPVPAKNTRPNTRIYHADGISELEAEPVVRPFDGFDEHHEEQARRQSKRESLLARQSSATSGEIRIAMTASTFNPNLNTMQNTMFTLHPLAMSPPSPDILSQRPPQIPTRPARPPSLRLSAFPRKKGGLTTSRVIVVDPDRPVTSESYSTQPHTGYTAATKGNRIKYGRGRYATTELVPQPTDDPKDPLVRKHDSDSICLPISASLINTSQNWQTWRKELNLFALLVMVAMSNVMKTALFSVNSVLVQRFNVSYVAVAALTGVPLMLSAITGMTGTTVSRLWGRRPVYLASMVLIFIGLVWNAKVMSSYGQFMTARIFQGFGWGAFDTMVVGSIMDTYFVSQQLSSPRSPAHPENTLVDTWPQEHERSAKIAVYRIVSVATTWGPPLIGGVTSQNALGLNLQFEILAIFQAISIPLLVLGAPETMYDRTSRMFEKPTAGWTPRTGWSSLGLKSSSRFRRLPAWARGRGLSLDRAIQYAKEVAPLQSYAGAAGGVGDAPLLLQAPRAAIAPTTVLSFLASFLPYSLLWGLSASLSGLFTREPFTLFPATVGSLLATPFILSTVTVAIFSLWPNWSQTTSAFRVRSTHLCVLGGGAALSFIGILGFGLYVSTRLNDEEPDLRFSAVSFILGLLATGAYVLDAPTKPLIHQSTQYTSPNLSVSLRNAADMDAGVATWRAMFAGIFAMGIPAAVATSAAGLKSTGIGVAVVQVLITGGVGAVWYMWDENVRRLDGIILGCIARKFAGPRSYFEVDE